MHVPPGYVAPAPPPRDDACGYPLLQVCFSGSEQEIHSLISLAGQRGVALDDVARDRANYKVCLREFTKQVVESGFLEKIRLPAFKTVQFSYLTSPSACDRK